MDKSMYAKSLADEAYIFSERNKDQTLYCIVALLK